MNFQTAKSSPWMDPSWRSAAMRASLPTGAVLGRCFVKFHKARLQMPNPLWVAWPFEWQQLPSNHTLCCCWGLSHDQRTSSAAKQASTASR